MLSLNAFVRSQAKTPLGGFLSSLTKTFRELSQIAC
nr:MAG TPA: hypothetical protein [Siphoviridae sp. ctcOR4]